MWSHFLYPPSPSHSEAIRPDCLIPLHLTPHVNLDVYKAENTHSILDYRTSKPEIRNTASTHRPLKVFNFSPTAPISHSQWSSRSTEYTRRSRTCRPAATGLCKNSVGQVWASSRSESLRTSYCKWGARRFFGGERKRR